MACIPLWRRLFAEILGGAFLAAVVVGSGIAGQRLSPGNVGLELFENAAATAAGLFTIILMFGPVSVSPSPEGAGAEQLQPQSGPTSGPTLYPGITAVEAAEVVMPHLGHSTDSPPGARAPGQRDQR